MFIYIKLISNRPKAAADKTIRIWKDGKQLRVIQGHTDAVRGLARLAGVGFISCSNDG